MNEEYKDYGFYFDLKEGKLIINGEEHKGVTKVSFEIVGNDIAKVQIEKFITKPKLAMPNEVKLEEFNVYRMTAHG